jgi:hypothetical protein
VVLLRLLKNAQGVVPKKCGWAEQLARDPTKFRAMQSSRKFDISTFLVRKKRSIKGPP